jgi:uncharacterized membrane protein YgdD (TMEM256/DUF423 family)
MKNTGLIFGAAIGFVGVALGAFGAHGLEDLLTANGREATWETAVLYQFVHAGLLLVLGILDSIHPSAKLLRISTWTTIAGILVFSGSLYVLSLTNVKWLGAITPIGGLCFLVAWSLLLFHSLRIKKNQ